MNKKKLMIIASSAIAVFVFGFLIYILLVNNGKESLETASASTVKVSNFSSDYKTNYTYIPPTTEYDDNNIIEEEVEEVDIENSWTPATEIDLDPRSITVLVNKEHSLPRDFVPENMVVPNVLFDILHFNERKLMHPEAAAALENLFAAALSEGHILYGISGYRSYDRQHKIFLNNIVKKGKEHTLKYSAVPGTSEHQTGLAIDISTKNMKFRLSTSFENSKEGIWVAENAHRYGYIVRYPKGKSEITGYAYEPWHIRYVGKDLAYYMYENSLTLEEYYKYVPSEDFDFFALYADLINYIPPPELLEESEDPEYEFEEEIGTEIEDPLTEDIIEQPEETVLIETPEPTKPPKKPKKPPVEQEQPDEELNKPDNEIIIDDPISPEQENNEAPTVTEPPVDISPTPALSEE